MEYTIDNKENLTDLKNAIQFQADDDVAVVDLDAENICDLKDSYVGKYIAQCDICKQLVYLDDRDLTKIEACPYCGFDHCFYLVGQVTAVTPEEFVEQKAEEDENQYTKAELVYGEATEEDK